MNATELNTELEFTAVMQGLLALSEKMDRLAIRISLGETQLVPAWRFAAKLFNKMRGAIIVDVNFSDWAQFKPVTVQMFGAVVTDDE